MSIEGSCVYPWGKEKQRPNRSLSLEDNSLVSFVLAWSGVLSNACEVEVETSATAGVEVGVDKTSNEKLQPLRDNELTVSIRADSKYL